VCILLDARVPRVSVLGPVALRVDSNNVDKLLASRQFTRPKSVHATALKNDANELKHLFESKNTQIWEAI
jgi:hypothetical protein